MKGLYNFNDYDINFTRLCDRPKIDNIEFNGELACVGAVVDEVAM